MAEIVLHEVDFQKATDEQWTRFHEYRAQRHEEKNPGDPIQTNETIEAFFKQKRPHRLIRQFAVTESSDPELQIGHIYFEITLPSSPSYIGNEDTAYFTLAVLQSHRGKGNGRQLLLKLHSLMKEHKRTMMVSHSSESNGRKFFEAIGATETVVRNELRLKRADIDWDVIRNWAKFGAKVCPDITMEFYKEIPEEILEHYATVYTSVANMGPATTRNPGCVICTPKSVREMEKTIRAAGGQWITALARNRAGSIVGVTEVKHFPSRPSIIDQHLTGVRKSHRGAGLGKWLKAAMLLHVADEFPNAEQIVTSVAKRSKTIMALNESMGFVVRRENAEVSMSFHTLEAYLEKAGLI